ncbi:MAG: HEAT repeat domain-containing protein, partial [Chloroflexi bacterium]|nr:HEAT repeat domain-containing protein [Chloroflexota bacterium]
TEGLDMKFEEYLRELGDQRHPLAVAKLTKLSGLMPDRLASFTKVWQTMTADRRRRIVRELNELAEDNIELDFEAIFVHCLSDEDEQVRLKAIEGLWESTDRHLMDRLVALLLHDPAEAVRAAAATSLGRYAMMGELGELRPRDVKKVEDALLEAIENTTEGVEVRRRAVESIGALAGEKETAVIERAYCGEEHKLRISAVYAMGKNCNERWLPYLLKELGSKDAEMRFEAAGACGELEDPRAVPCLLPLLADEDMEVRLSAIGALGHIGGETATKTLRLCLEHPDERMRDAASAALEEAEFASNPLGLNLDL